MEPPSSGGSGTAARSSSVNQMAFCHECGIEIRPLMTPDPTCPRCNGQFVEIIEENAAHPDDFDDFDDDDPFAAVHGDPFPGFRFRTGGGGAAAPPLSFVQGAPGAQIPGGLGGLLMALAGGAARNPASGAGHGPESPSSPHSPSDRRSTSDQDDASDRRSSQNEAQSNTRSGSTSFGPFGLQWNVQYGSGGGDPYQRAAQHQAEHNTRQQQQQQQPSDLRSPPTLSNFLRFAFGPNSDSIPDAAPRNEQDPYFHDDGMGGAGGVADGRHFNHDNRGTYHQPPQSPNSTTRPTNELPPELAALRNLFTGLFGEPGAQGGSLLDILASGAHGGGMGPRGQWGDYVLGQQGLDDIISQLMEQTQGSNAPPPATEDVIDKLERFTLADKERIERAKNQECPTCKDEFLPSPPEEGKDSEKQGGEEDSQQEQLISMPCAHIFHVDCLVPWLRLHGTCPVCRVSIVKPREGDAADSNNSNNAAPSSSQTQTQNDASANVPGGWPSPPNPFSSFFQPASANPGVQIPRDSDSPGATTRTYHPQPPTSTTVTSTVYPSPLPPSAGAASTGLADAEVVNSIVSSPPIVSDREEFFSTPPDHAPMSGGGGEHDRDDMRERMRRAAEARMGENENSRTQGAPARFLEPDELD